MSRVRPLARALLALTLLLAALLSAGPTPQTEFQVAAAAPAASPLSLTDRVACQTALEEVSWQHRTWPTENPNPKPTLSTVLSPAQIAAQVEDSLRQSAALERLRGQPLTGEQLQAELDRMAAGSRQPEVLAELFSALGNDPHRAAECLARPALADRLLRSWFADDERWQGEARARAHAALAGHPTVEQLPGLGGQYTVAEWVQQQGAAPPAGPGPDGGPAQIELSPEEWQELVGRLARTLAPAPPVTDPTATPSALLPPAVADASALPVGVVGALQEETDTLYAQAVLSRGPDRLTVATVSWAKAPFDQWWARTAPTLPATVAEPGAAYVLPALAGACTDDTWPASPGLSSVVPDPRTAHTAVWTGSEMIVWGGFDGSIVLQTGGRYTPATDTWGPTTTNGAPGGRAYHAAVWTGSQMIVWGGYNGSVAYNDGGRYTPGNDSWSPVATTGAPPARYFHTMVWTGSQAIVWGGFDSSSVLPTGGKYTPATDTWSPTTTSGAPSGRAYHTAVWTGSQMIVWGGFDGSYLNTGSRYTPGSDNWVPTTTTGGPGGRYLHTAVWTGSQMIIWGGYNGSSMLNSGGRYTPGSDSWSPTANTGAPGGRVYHTAVWTGSQMIVWGGYDGASLNTGGRYTPGSDSWSPTSTTGAPGAHYGHTAVWTGSQMLIWGGTATSYLNSGGRYSPASDSWAPTSTASAPSGRFHQTAVWTGNEMLVWGGTDWITALNTGGRYTPATDTWAPTSTTGAPGRRYQQTAVWTGSQMLVWGGTNGASAFNTGGRYSPGTDTWQPISTTGAPGGRYVHTAVWTGSQMLVWGGYDDMSSLNTGGRYSPGSDTWQPISTTGAPSARQQQTAVWTGSQMLIWGGYDGAALNTGGRYSPGSDTWAPISTTTAPSARVNHTAVWTGNQMLVWGGWDGSAVLNTGSRYSPGSDTWAPTATTDAPGARYRHTAVWTGNLMLVWGGGNVANLLASGGRYSPVSDRWHPTTATAAPGARFVHTAVWTGTQMLVWGGFSANIFSSGGSYCALGNTAWFFAEGYTGPGFDEYLTLQNPGTLPATVQVTYMSAGAPLVGIYTVLATSRSTLKINDEIGPNRAVSLQVLSDRFIVAERPMYFSYGPGGWTGGHDVVGAVSPATTWYFAEGYTGPGFDEYLTLQNPGNTAASVTLTYYLASGGPVVKTVNVPANSRATVAVHDTAQGVGRNQAVSTKVSSDRPIVAERPMYFSYGPAGWTGGHVVVGATAPSPTWYFAEGYTGPGFDEYLTLQNPNGSAASVTLTYFLAGGGPVMKSVNVPATSRYTVAVHDSAEGVGRNQAVSVKVSSSLPIVAERPMYFQYGAGGWTGGHDVVGATAPAARWYFAEGYTGAGFDEYLTLQNPNGSAATVTVTYLRGSGSPIVKSYPVAGNQRATLKVNDEVGPNQAVSMQVESTLPIVAERPMYFSYGLGWTGGHDVLGYAP